MENFTRKRVFSHGGSKSVDLPIQFIRKLSSDTVYIEEQNNCLIIHPEDELTTMEVEFAARLRKATLDVIPEDPNKSEYLLKRELKQFRRYKQGLQRYRLLFAFSNKPAIILYLYVNDHHSLRKDGSTNDPYKIFSGYVKKC